MKESFQKSILGLREAETQQETGEKKLTLSEVEEGLEYAKNTGRLLEQAYWEDARKKHQEKPLIKEVIESPSQPYTTEILEGLSKTVPGKREVPIKPGEFFEPKEELEEIKKLPKEQRKERLQQYKEKLAYQKDKLAVTQEQLIDEIRSNPDISWEELSKRAFDLITKFGLSLPQEDKIKEVLGNYWWKHKAIKEVREKFPDDNKIFEAIFGRPPRGKIEVIEGPVTLYFRCRNNKDYAFLSKQTFLENREPSIKERLAARLQGGISLGTSLIPNLQGTIIAERAKGDFNETQKGIYAHEEQHAIKRLFNEKPTKEVKVSSEIPLTENLRIRRERTAELWVKDEILAYMKEGLRGPDDIFYILTTSGKLGGLYDYLAEDRKDAIAYFSKNKNPDEKRKVIETVKKVFETEYHQLIKNGIKSFQVLLNHGYTLEQTIALLNAEPLAKWPKTIKRLIEQSTI